MSALPIRQAIITRLDELTEDEAAAVLDFIESLQLKRDEAEHDAPHDPLAGFFEGPSDLAERSEEILHQEFGLFKPRDVEEP